MNQNTLERIFRQWVDWKHKFSTAKNTWKRFSSLCRDIVIWKADFTNSAFQTGFGIPKDWNIPIRLPVILIPTLEIMKWLLQVWITPPKFIIYQATTVIAAINKIDSTDATASSQIMESRLYEFILWNFPELLQYITFSFWKKDNDIETVTVIWKYVSEVTNFLPEETSKYFQKSWEKHTNWDVQHLYYVTANNLYNWGYPETPFPEVGQIDEVIPVWGRSETQFFKTLLETQISCRDIFPLITQVWAFPTYYKYPRWDVQTYEEVSEHIFWHSNLHPDIQKDLKILSQYNTI